MTTRYRWRKSVRPARQVSSPRFTTSLTASRGAATKSLSARMSSKPRGGLRWSVVESLPVAEAIKLGEGDLPSLVRELSPIAAQSRSRRCHDRLLQFHAGARLDRTQLATTLPNGGTALRFNAHEYAAFDCFILKRPGAEAEQRPDVLECGTRVDWSGAAQADKDRLLATIMAGLPGAYDRYDVAGLRCDVCSLRRHRSRRAARKPEAVSRRSHADRRRSRRSALHSSRRSATPVVWTAAHCVERATTSNSSPGGRQPGQWHHFVHRLARRRSEQLAAAFSLRTASW